MVCWLLLPLPCLVLHVCLSQAVAQGRVWTGQRALQRKLVDALGGIHEAVALVKQAAGIDQNEQVTVMEVSRSRTSPLALLGRWMVRGGRVSQFLFSRS